MYEDVLAAICGVTDEYTNAVNDLMVCISHNSSTSPPPPEGYGPKIRKRAYRC